MDMVQWNRTVDTWDMYMCVCKSSWYVCGSPVESHLGGICTMVYSGFPSGTWYLMADLDIPQAPDRARFQKTTVIL